VLIRAPTTSTRRSALAAFGVASLTDSTSLPRLSEVSLVKSLPCVRSGLAFASNRVQNCAKCP
jgi:hypothetical protein